MTIQVGDRVSFKHAVGEGEVVKIEDGAYHVMLEGGFDSPYPLEELVLLQKADKASLYSQSNDEAGELTLDTPEEVRSAVQEHKAVSILCVLQTSRLNLLLSNGIDTEVIVKLVAVRKNKQKILFAGVLEAKQQLLLSETLPLNTHLNMQAIFLGSVLQAPSDSSICLSRDFLESLSPVTRNYPQWKHWKPDADNIDLAELKANWEPKSKALSDSASTSLDEVDLHLNLHEDNLVGLSAFEILSKQVEKFRGEMDACIKARKIGIIFIHGVGSGSLKTKIRELLDTDYPFCQWREADTHKYGQGATEVILT